LREFGSDELSFFDTINQVNYDTQSTLELESISIFFLKASLDWVGSYLQLKEFSRHS
jgi:hypothetical protein